MAQLNLPLTSSKITNNTDFVVNSSLGGEALRIDVDGKINVGNCITGGNTVDGNPHGHKLQAKLLFEGDEIVVTSTCDTCNIDLDRKVIYKIPQKVMRQKCLPRMVKDICG